MANLTTGKGIALIVGLANSIATKKAQQYESIGVTNIVAGPGANQITFTLANSQTYTVSLTFNASGVSFTPPEGMTSTTVQTAIQELFNEINATVTTLNEMGGAVTIEAGDNITVTKNTTTKKITISAGGTSNISDVKLNSGTNAVVYDSTNGATITSTGKITHENGSEDAITSEYVAPLVPGSGISMDATEDNHHVEIKAVAEYITISAPASATNGTLAEGQLAKLQSSENVHIMFNNELYRMQSKGHAEGYLTYSMTEYESNATMIKSITVTISTRGWVLTTQNVDKSIQVTSLPQDASTGNIVEYVGETMSVYDNNWATKTWTGLTSFDGAYIWTDNTNYYYSYGTTQYALNPATNTWSEKTWTGLTNFTGAMIWTDGTHIYYSFNTSQYELNVDTSTWTTKTWTGLVIANPLNIWKEGNNIYYSAGNSQYELDVATSTWTAKTWTGLTSFNGAHVWSDNQGHIYYSNDTTQYELNVATSTWAEKEWFGLTSFAGNKIWTDGTNIYYSDGATQYKLDVATSTWTAKTWTGLIEFTCLNVWKEGNNIYYSNGSNQYSLEFSTFTNGYFYQKGASGWSQKDVQPAGSSTLSALTDVGISSPTNNQVLGYNSTTQKWENQDASSGGVTDVQVNGTTIVTSNVANMTSVNMAPIVRAVIPQVKTTVDATLAVNTIYSLGEQSSLSLVLPTSSIGNCIEIQFFSGSTPTTLSITSSAIISDLDLTPEANKSYILFCEWGPLTTSSEGWIITYSSATYTS